MLRLRDDHSIKGGAVVMRESYYELQMRGQNRHYGNQAIYHQVIHQLIKRFGERQLPKRNLNRDFPQACNAQELLVSRIRYHRSRTGAQTGRVFY